MTEGEIFIKSVVSDAKRTLAIDGKIKSGINLTESEEQYLRCKYRYYLKYMEEE